MTMELRLLSVNVGRPQIIGAIGGEAVRSGIVKSPVTAASVRLGATNIEGDEQADLSVHGGVDKAVYCYSADHWSWWEREHGLACRPAAFGENLTIEGADETAVAIGDRFLWGDTLIEVSQPRAPCYKFAIKAQRSEAPGLMTASGRCGWYFRVLKEGIAPATGPITRVRMSEGPSVREAFFAVLNPKCTAESLRRVFEFPELAEIWRTAVGKRLALR